MLEPERDWAFLQRVYLNLRRTAKPSRDKLSRMVRATQLLGLGIRLMDRWERGQNQACKVTRYRDGLLIALLISCPIRVTNLAGLVIGQHLVFDGHDYRLEITAAETKTGRPYVADVPHELTPYIDRWLQVHRPAAQLIAPDGREADSVERRLWLGHQGRPLSVGAIQRQIALRTEHAFGKSIRPHLFRDCAVTELVDVAPEEIGIAHDLLGHAGLRTTQKHYIQAQGMTAHRRVKDSIAARRRAAARRSRGA